MNKATVVLLLTVAIWPLTYAANALPLTNSTLFKPYDDTSDLLGATAATITTTVDSNVGYTRIQFYTASDCSGTAAGAVVLNKGQFAIAANTPFKLNASAVYSLAESVATRTGGDATAYHCIRLNFCNLVANEGYPGAANRCVERGESCPIFSDMTCTGGGVNTCESSVSHPVTYTIAGSDMCTDGVSSVYARPGDVTYGGVVASTGTQMQENLVEPVADQSSSIVWGGDGIDVAGSATDDGASNTQLIVAAIGDGTYAAKLCAVLTFTSLGQTVNDWFLPAVTNDATPGQMVLI